MSLRFCRRCGAPLPQGVTLRALYCSERCRRAYQDARRKDERAEASERKEREAGRVWLQSDPWSVFPDVGAEIDEDEARWLLAGIDPLPPEYWKEAEAIAGPMPVKKGPVVSGQ